MEVIVDTASTSGILPDSILSIRNGQTRRQAPFATVDKPFKFPAKPEDCVPIKIDVFRHVGTARTVSQAGSNECKLVLEPIKRPAGYQEPAIGDMQIAFQVRPASIDTIQTMGSGAVDPIKRDKQIEDSDSYLERHKITQFLQAILQSLIKEEPLDPYGYIVKQFVAEANQVAADLRSQVCGALSTGLQTGALDEALNETFGTKQRLEDASRGVQDLQKMVDNLTKQLATMEEENKKLRALTGKGEAGKDAEGDSELEVLRKRTRGTLLQSSKDGTLSKTLEQEALRHKSKEVLDAAVKSGALKEQVAEIEDVRQRSKQDLAVAAANGTLGAALQGSSNQEQASGQSKTGAGIDLSNVEALHKELEQLAKDRASLLSHVNKLKGKVQDLGVENEKLADSLV